MKRKTFSLFLALVMMVSLCCTVRVGAAEDNTLQLTGTAGSEVSWILNERLGYDVAEVVAVAGSIPAGTAYSIENGMLLLNGTPSTAGSYHASFSILADDGNDGSALIETTISVDVTIKEAAKPDYSLPTVKMDLNLNESVKITSDMESSGHITDYRITGDNLPDGMSGKVDTNGVTIQGAPVKTGTYRFSVSVYNSASLCWVTQPYELTVKGLPAPTVTKDPTAETVDENSRAVFIAKADNATSTTWYLLSADTITEYDVLDAPRHFPGLRVSGQGTEKLIFENVPLELNNWSVYAMFKNETGSINSKMATLRVNPVILEPPKIQTQPVGAEIAEGETTQLTVKATAPMDVSISYQWYKNTTRSSAGSVPISGAVSPTFTAKYEEGTVYYYCVLRSAKRDQFSETVKTDIVAVTGLAPETEPETTETEETTEVTETTAETVEIYPEETVPAKKSGSLVIPIILGVLFLATAGCGFLIVRQELIRRKLEQEDESEF